MKVIRDNGVFILSRSDEPSFYYNTIVVIEGNADFAKNIDKFEKLVGKLSDKSKLLDYTVCGKDFSFEIAMTSSSKYSKILKIDLLCGSERKTYYLFFRNANRRDITNSELKEVLVIA